MIRVALIGCGAIAAGYDAKTNAREVDGALTHLGALLNIGGFQVVLCVDPDESKTRRVKENFPEAVEVRSVHDLNVEIPKLDLAVISSPTELHEEHVDFCLKNGVSGIFCEKPFTSNYEISSRLLKLANRNKVQVGVNYFRLWDQGLLALKKEIADGVYGRLTSANGWFVKGISHNGPHMIVLLADFFGEVQATPNQMNSRGDFSVRLLSEPQANVSLKELDKVDYNFFELELFFENAIVRLEDGGRRIRRRFASSHTVYTGFAYPEDIQSENLDPFRALPAAWQNWRDVFEKGAFLVRDGTWCVEQEKVAFELDKTFSSFKE
ncbi:MULTISPECIES: Gfo/Idh/MocA family protein [Thalassospira]|uniref:Gfo/Idh/MocA family protein n=1 Tax=Thalassospira TaxID=168934 RepID=UPI000B06D3A0|nr:MULTISPECIES: Gfo/Idh/MocA family oxidoreductase [Thalassospira]MBR9899346.1 Gfo/Idh/MocA family oxidoreductase [Rhodospirillales bacterium]